jgi:hypothetical protein
MPADPENLHGGCRPVSPEFGWIATISKPGRSDEGGLKHYLFTENEQRPYFYGQTIVNK